NRDREPGTERHLGDRAADFRVPGCCAGLEGDGQTHAPCAAGEAGAAMVISAGKIRGAGAYAGGEHGGDGTGTVAGDAVCEAFTGEERRDCSVGGLFYLVEAGADRRAGAAVCLLNVS